jgi:hypothetical protein
MRRGSGRPSDDIVRSIVDTPDEVGEGLARQRGRVGERGEVLTDLLGIGLVLLELDPFGLAGELRRRRENPTQ